MSQSPPSLGRIQVVNSAYTLCPPVKNPTINIPNIGDIVKTVDKEGNDCFLKVVDVIHMPKKSLSLSIHIITKQYPLTDWEYDAYSEVCEFDLPPTSNLESLNEVALDIAKRLKAKYG